MKNSETHCVVLLVIVAHFLSSVYSSSTDTGKNDITIDCECRKTDCVNYYCNCQTYSNTTGEARERCFYDSSTNSCVKNETCDRIVTCDESCHKNATCKRNDSGHYDYACVCNDGFCGNGTHCQPKCNRFSTVCSAECKCPCPRMVYCCNVSSTIDEKAHIKAKVVDDFVNCFCQIEAIKFSRRNYKAKESDEMVMVEIEVDGCAVFKDIVVNVTTKNGTARYGHDYSLNTSSITFTPTNSGPKNISISLKRDNLLEMDEDFYVLLNVTDESVHMKNDEVKITIIDSSNATVFFEKTHYAFREGENVSVPIKLYGNITFPVNVSIVSGSFNATAIENSDYKIVNPIIVFKPNDGKKTIGCNLTIFDDGLVERNETFFLEISPNTKGKKSTKITIISKNVATVNFSKSCYSVWENKKSVSIEVILHGNITFDITVNVTTQDDSAKSEKDYILNTFSVKFTPNDSGPKIVNISLIRDDLHEMAEDFFVLLNVSDENVNITMDKTNITILDSDVDGCYREWGNWSQCSKTCGSGKKIRTGECSKPLYGGKNCHGDILYEEKICTNPVICPGEFNFTSWSEWSICNVPCNFGQRMRTRECKEDSRFCKGRTNQTETCDAGPCPQNGDWSTWPKWPYCPGSCGSAILNRSRTCNNPPPEYGGNNCSGAATEEMECNHTKPCANESGFTEWSTWSLCSKTCNNGEQVRERNCRPGQEVNCTLESLQRKLCFEKACPVNGGWSQWGEWSRCSSSCGSGVKYRVRLCNRPKPDNDGLKCYGKNREEESCVMPELCKVDHFYTSWGNWSACNATCGYGTKQRLRKCTVLPKYPPENLNPICISPAKDHQYLSCYDKSCKIDGNFSHWSFWSSCSVTCGGGVRRRKRMCDHPSPKYGGKDCPGKRLDVQDCYASETCPDDDSYKPWTSWSDCSRGCEGTTTRKRDCSKGNCSISQNQTKECNTELCVVNGSWSEWTSWSSCDLNKCGEQSERRNRFCNDPKPQAGGEQCMGDDFETALCRYGQPRPCDKKITRAGWTNWSWWKICSKSCGKGVESRYRRCINPPPTSGGLKCSGKSNETKFCNDYPCPVDGVYSEWSNWTMCSQTCANGTRNRSRTCTPPMHKGKECQGPNFTMEICNPKPCPIHGNWSSWSSWSFCSKPCNNGSSERTRSCTNPAPKYGGNNCSCDETSGSNSYGDCFKEVRHCNDFKCPPVLVRVETVVRNVTSSESNFKKEFASYIVESYGNVTPVVGYYNLTLEDNTAYFVVTARFNFSDGDQLPILRDILDLTLHGYWNISLMSMKSDVVYSKELQIITESLTSTSIRVNWTLFEKTEKVEGIMIFHRTMDGHASFVPSSQPPSYQGNFTIENLKKYTNYKITVSPATKNGTGIPSNFSTLRTLEDKPSRAPEIQVHSPNTSSLIISWNRVNSEYLHGIHRGYCIYHNNELIHVNDTSVQMKLLEGFRPYSKHTIQIAAKTSPGCGIFTPMETYFTAESKPDGPPNNVSAWNESSKSVKVSWQEVDPQLRNGIIIGYNITYNSSRGRSGNIILNSSKIFHLVIENLSEWTWYTVSVSAYNKIDRGPSFSVDVRTDEGTPLHPPDVFEARNSSSSSIYLRWHSLNGSVENGVFLGYEATYIPLNYKHAKRETIRLKKMEYNITGLFYYWQYKITVGGYTRSGVGKQTVLTIRTDEHIPRRSPENVRAEVETSTSIYVDWANVTSNFVHGILLGYNVEIQRTKDGSTRKVEAPPGEKDRPTYVTNLKKYTEYTIWVRARNSKGIGQLNSPDGFRLRTKEDAPDAAPSNIRVSSMVSISVIKLQWDKIPEDKANGIIRGYYIEYTATNLNGQNVELNERVTKTVRVRGNRDSIDLENLTPGSTYDIRIFGYTIKNGTKSNLKNGRTCNCPEYIKVNWWNIPPYTDRSIERPGGIFAHTVDFIIDMCGDCKNGHGKSKPCYRPGCNQPSSRRRRAIDSYHQESFQNFLNNINDDVDVSFPVQGNKYLTHHGGIQPYVSVIENTGSVYFTVKKTPSTAHVIVNAAVESIPLLLFILLLSILAGMIIWILERSSNPYSFPLSFVKGVKEGFWWAFISASTVGYGDRRPVTIPGKVFAIIWILIGHVIITLLTSWMVNSITLVLVEQRYSIYGSKIAVVENSTEFGRAIRKNGRVVGYPNVDKVIEALKKAKVDGALLDMYAAATRKDLFSSGEIKLNRQVQYPSGYGIVLSGRMKESAPMIREHFKAKASELFEIIQNNTDVITQKSNRVKEVASIKSGLFDVSSRAFRLSIVIIFSMLAFSFLAGLYWQYKYHYKASKLRHQLQSEAPSYPKYKILREHFKRLCEEELKDLKNRLIMLKAKHMKELKLLTKLKKESVHSLPTSSQNRQVSGSVSFVQSTLRLPRCSASVAPISNSQTNFALKVMDLDEEHGANKLSEDSEV